MGNIAIYLRLPCWRFTRRNLPIHSELVSGVSRVGLQEGFPHVANIYIFFFFFSEHIIVRTSLPRCVCQIDACPPPLCLLLSSYQTHLGCLSPIIGRIRLVKFRPTMLGSAHFRTVKMLLTEADQSNGNFRPRSNWKHGHTTNTFNLFN